MLDAFWTLFDTDRYTLMVVCSLVAPICWLIKITMGSSGYAICFAPFLVVSGLAANRFLLTSVVLPSSDKDTNIALASAIGVFVALVLLLIASWISVILSERRSRRMKILGPIDLPPPTK